MTGYHSPSASHHRNCKNKCGTIVKYGERCPKCYPRKTKCKGEKA